LWQYNSLVTKNAIPRGGFSFGTDGLLSANRSHSGPLLYSKDAKFRQYLLQIGSMGYICKGISTKGRTYKAQGS
jgi:hypothetical protein